MFIAAARPLAELLRQPGMHGYAVTDINDINAKKMNRHQATRELILARALYLGLFMNCLMAYTEARSASEVEAFWHDDAPSSLALRAFVCPF